MTEDTRKICEQNMQDAIASGDQSRIWQALARSFSAMMECQQKTRGTQKDMNNEMITLRSDMVGVKADVKELKIESKEASALKYKVSEIDKDVQEMKPSHEEFKAFKERSKGALWMGRVALVAGGGVVYDIIIRLIDHFGK